MDDTGTRKDEKSSGLGRTAGGNVYGDEAIIAEDDKCFDGFDKDDAGSIEAMNRLRRDRGILELAGRTGCAGPRSLFRMEIIDKETQGNEKEEKKEIRQSSRRLDHSSANDIYQIETKKAKGLA